MAPVELLLKYFLSKFLAYLGLAFKLYFSNSNGQEKCKILHLNTLQFFLYLASKSSKLNI